MSGLVAVRNVKSELFNPVMARASGIIKDHTAIFVAEDGLVGSGTFVTACGYAGVLTAHHVAEHLLGFSQFVFVGNLENSIRVFHGPLEHVPIGPVRKDAQPEIGPDLSFLIIRDPTLVWALQIGKVFYPLDVADLSSFRAPTSPKFWAVAGSPLESLEQITDNYLGAPLSRMLNFVGTGDFQSDIMQADFDYLKLKVPSGQFGFPYRYDGMSGGGFWLIPMEIDANGDTNTIGHKPPLLAGVEFSQSDRDKENREIVLTGHGIDSIYSRVRQALQAG